MAYRSPGCKAERKARARRRAELMAKYPGKTYWEAAALDAKEFQQRISEWAKTLKK